MRFSRFWTPLKKRLWRRIDKTDLKIGCPARSVGLCCALQVAIRSRQATVACAISLANPKGGQTRTEVRDLARCSDPFPRRGEVEQALEGHCDPEERAAAGLNAAARTVVNPLKSCAIVTICS